MEFIMEIIQFILLVIGGACAIGIVRDFGSKRKCVKPQLIPKYIINDVGFYSTALDLVNATEKLLDSGYHILYHKSFINDGTYVCVLVNENNEERPQVMVYANEILQQENECLYNHIGFYADAENFLIDYEGDKIQCLYRIFTHVFYSKNKSKYEIITAERVSDYMPRVLNSKHKSNYKIDSYGTTSNGTHINLYEIH